ncbi:MAG: hypothetical protein FJ291_09020 [Planctomycetes bacterium]|nr:hypothetical protein [Planctomycetota bacterium]
MQLDDFLNSRSVATLQVLQWHWAPNTPRSASKSELLRILRQAMLAPDRARDAFNALSPTAQDLLQAILRQDDYTANVAALLRRVARPPLGTAEQAERDVVEELSRRGFLLCATTRDAAGAECLRATVPQELGDVLAEALNLDIREPQVMLSLRTRLGLAGRPNAAIPAELLEPQAIERRIAALPDPAAQRAVRLALHDHAGVLPLERFPSLGLDIEAADPAQWRRSLEAALLGTLGHLSLTELGLGDDHDCLVLYQELVEAHAAARSPAGPSFDHVYSCGTDFLADVTALVDFLRANPSKPTSAGRLLKGARNLLAPLTALRSTFFMDEDTLLGHKLAAAQELALLERCDDERLHATRSAADWERLPLAEQARALLDALLRLAQAACPDHHFPSLAAVARRIIAASTPGTWHPTNAFLARTLSRFLLELLSSGGQASAKQAVPWVHPRALSTVGALAAAAREPLLQAFNYAGVLDIARQGGQSFVAASPLVPAILGDAAFPSPAGRLILVNPDFEVILFPDEGHAVLLHALAAFCDRGKREVTLHLRITRDSVQRAVLRGLSPDDVLATLRANSRAPVPQNIEYSIRDWAGGVHPAAIRTLHVLELPSAEAMDAALCLPELAPLIVRRLSPTAAVLNAAALGPDAESALRQLGIHLM